MLVCAAAGTVLFGASACGITGANEPGEIVVPPTDRLSTETEAPTTTSSTGPQQSSTRETNLPKWTIGRTVTAAPRVDNSRYHPGAVTADSPLVDTSGFNFTTPSRSVSCSTGTNGRDTLACEATGLEGAQNPPANTPSTCQWAPEMIILSNSGPTHGACANLYPVMHRGTIVNFGQSISISRFTCLSHISGLYCLHAQSGNGFSITSDGYREINAADAAPSALLGIASTSTSAPDDETSDTSSPPTS
ncbi:hypothetical protein GOEFS_014_00200 [Gordonia effusa NBRC 100432]|uniref:Uncharacterized protein n=1 Tax=Gordonia effusa NBRC 100432 TaxID=1077974 RepID=H0QVC7_9ACTN|nr:hypothetical protein GOEFS_014_00200 [Gordonia effusa NBRC 100432]